MQGMGVELKTLGSKPKGQTNYATALTATSPWLSAHLSFADEDSDFCLTWECKLTLDECLLKC